MESSFTIQCWGCNYSETYRWNGPGPEHDAIIDEMKSRGWQRREFGPGADPWFCSHNCAYKSHNARQAEQWWADKEFQEYSQKSAHNAGIALFVMMLAAITLFGVCSYVGVQ